MKNWKIYISIVLLYIAMQFGSIPAAEGFINYFKNSRGFEPDEARFYGFAWALFITNLIAAPIILFMTTRNKQFWDIFKKGKKASPWMTVVWGVLGFFMAMAGQMLAGIIEMALGIMPGSDNTALLSEVAKSSPIIIISIVIFAPLLEEIVFRRVLFGGLYTKSNFWVAAILSGVIFAVVHGELEHTLIYMAPGLVFAFLYYHTKRIWAPMIAHFMMNGFVMIVQLNMDKLLEFQERHQAFIFLLP
ncbi:CPBP family intramembrane metalloprotease [Sporosarcina sp. ACRSL]|uniref:CPBP family intramembrane glutamic endopeptidase n=1 Tax=Sporosarcina sp. ACRSL TaxID=2918215 RepID=UPI001EF4F49E|nr:type II CAAX endopeptidase family protein [Sporosarcina sp. ACRSL]MCG7346124.1 CPBP family intramembrane metalloprotease [Sporosarcina sp. ACRSL]